MACQCRGTEHALDCSEYDVWSDFDKYTASTSSDPIGTTLGIVSPSLAKLTCCHLLDPFVLRDGSTIHASSSYTRKMRTVEPDVGIYLDSTWVPECFAYSIGWQDYGLPFLTDRDVLRVARVALSHVRAGEVVEVACIGGHGRTGTFLAIMDLLASDRPVAKRSIHAVRDEYCSKAIETREQAWYVGKIAALLVGSPIPARPAFTLKGKSSGVIASKTKRTKGGKRKKI